MFLLHLKRCHQHILLHKKAQHVNDSDTCYENILYKAQFSAYKNNNKAILILTFQFFKMFKNIQDFVNTRIWWKLVTLFAYCMSCDHFILHAANLVQDQFHLKCVFMQFSLYYVQIYILVSYEFPFLISHNINVYHLNMAKTGLNVINNA